MRHINVALVDALTCRVLRCENNVVKMIFQMWHSITPFYDTKWMTADQKSLIKIFRTISSINTFDVLMKRLMKKKIIVCCTQFKHGAINPTKTIKSIAKFIWYVYTVQMHIREEQKKKLQFHISGTWIYFYEYKLQVQ